MYCNKLFILLSMLFCLAACGDDEIMEAPASDYRDKWEGTYVGTKSNTSLEDDMFTTEIEFEAVKDSSSLDGMIINDILFPMSEAGTYGPDFIDDGIFNYTVTIVDDNITIEAFGSIIDGIIAPCFIKAMKQ